MATAPTLDVTPFYDAKMLEIDASTVLRMGEIQAAKTLGVYQMMGQSIATIGQTVAQIYESKNRTAVEMWKIGEDQRRFDLEFGLRQEQAAQERQLKALEIEKVRNDTQIALANAKKARAQEWGDRTLGQPFALTATDLIEDPAKGLLRYRDLRKMEGMSIIDPDTGENLGIVSGDYLQGKMQGLFAEGGGMTTPLRDQYNPQGMTLKQAYSAVFNPMSPHRDEALRLLAANSSAEAFEELATTAGMGPGTPGWTRLQDHINDPVSWSQGRRLEQLKIAAMVDPSEANQAAYDRAAASFDKSSAAAKGADPSSEYKAVQEAIGLNADSFEEQIEKGTRTWLDEILARANTSANSSVAQAANPLGSLLVQSWPTIKKKLRAQDTNSRIGGLSSLGQKLVQSYLAGDDNALRQLNEKVLPEMNRAMQEVNGPRVTQRYFAHYFIPDGGYMPSGIPKTVPGESREWNNNLRSLFQITVTSPMQNTTTVSPTQVGLSKSNPFPNPEAALAAGLPSGTTVFYLKPDGQVYSAPIQ